MTAPTPILTAEIILTTAIRNALAPGAGTHQGRPKVYYQLNTDNAPKPLVIFQLQTDIARLNTIGAIGATVPVLIKALATYPDAAQDLLAAVTPGMDALTYAGYSLTARYLRSPLIPPKDGVYYAAHLFTLTLERTP